MTKEELLERCIVLNRRINYEDFVIRECGGGVDSEDTYFYSWFRMFYSLGFLDLCDLGVLILLLDDDGVCEFLRDELRAINKNTES